MPARQVARFSGRRRCCGVYGVAVIRGGPAVPPRVAWGAVQHNTPSSRAFDQHATHIKEHAGQKGSNRKTQAYAKGTRKECAFHT
eukprot:6173564-Heterocapsa_arctica.AAC.1